MQISQLLLISFVIAFVSPPSLANETDADKYSERVKKAGSEHPCSNTMLDNIEKFLEDLELEVNRRQSKIAEIKTILCPESLESLANGMEADKYFDWGKEAYNKDDCLSAVLHFEKYLEHSKLEDNNKRQSIIAAIEWCQKKIETQERWNSFKMQNISKGVVSSLDPTKPILP